MTDDDAALATMRSTYWWGVPTLFGCPHDSTATDLDVALVGVPHSSGNGSTERDQHLGPRALRNVSGNYRRRHRRFGTVPFEIARVGDVGDVVMPDFMVSDLAVGQIEARFRAIDATGARPIAIGGDHSITLPILRALAGPAARRHDPVALVHLDAHTDTYDGMATWFGVVDSAAHWASKAVHEGCVDATASLQIGMRGNLSPWAQSGVSERLGYRVIDKDACDDLGLDGVVAAIRERVGSRPIYVSFDLDCLDPAAAPAVSNLEPGAEGFTMKEATRILQGLRGLDLVGADVVCMIPTKDSPNQITALNATAIMFELITLAAESAVSRR